MTEEEWRQELINKTYNGDINAYEACIQLGRKDAVQWSDLRDCAAILPELAEEARQFIEQRLGYTPNPQWTYKNAPFVRGIIQAKRQSVISKEQYQVLIDGILTQKSIIIKN